MPAHKGNKYALGNKGGGTKTKREFVLEAFNMGLANSIMNEEIAKIKEKKARKHEEIKDFVTPFVLKGIKTESTITLKTPKPLDDMSDIVANVSQAKP